MNYIEVTRITPRAKITDSKGVVIDNGANLPIQIGKGLPKNILTNFAQNIRANVSKQDWLIKVI